MNNRGAAVPAAGFIGVAVCICVLLASFPAGGYAQERPSVTAVRTTGPMRLDGVLNEGAWDLALPVTDFTQRELVEGAEPSERTEVRIVYDESNFYIGIICYDSSPGEIVNSQMRYDSELEQDDSFAVMLDPFNDQRTGYLFVINPNGARQDAIFDDVEHRNEDWNGIWDASARITDTGWTAEIEIPFLSLRFPDAERQRWGINFRRIIRRRNEEVLWTAWGRDDGIQQIAESGVLEGLVGIERGKSADIQPYLLGGLEHKSEGGSDDVLKAGLDVKYPLTGDLTLDFTTRTDFAQVESDKEQMNLTRFSMQYPEKRQFFLEGADIFDVSSNETMLFYSRRIGLTPDPDREVVPIVGGVKLSGKTGPWSIGLMSMQTEETTVRVDEDTTTVVNVYPATNNSVLRIKRDVLDQSYLGFIVTSVRRTRKPVIHSTVDDGDDDPLLNTRSNVLAGLDFNYRTADLFGDKNFSVSGFLAGTETPGVSGGNLGGRLFIDYPNDTIDSWASYEAVGPNFNPELGYARRTGIRTYSSVFRYTPRVDFLPHVKKLLFMPYEITYTTDMGTDILTRTYELRPFGVELDNGDQATFNLHFHYDYVDEEYEVFDNTVMPVDRYEYWHWMFQYRSDNTSRVSFESQVNGGEYYSGTRDSYSAEVTVKLNKYLSVIPDVSYTDIDLATGSFIAREVSTRLEANLSPRLTSSTFVQWNNKSEEMNLNFRIHYIPKIGSDLYIVYDHLWEEDPLPGREDRFVTLRNTGVVKINYLFRF